MDNFDDIMRQAAALPKEIAPEQDLWPAIEKGIAPPRHGFWQWRLAASVIATSALIGLLLIPPADDNSTGRIAAAPSVPALSAQLVRHMPFDDTFILDYQQALDALDSQLAQLPPGTREVIIGNLTIVRESIADINQAIDNDPGNVQLLQLLQLAYRQEMAIISMVRDSVASAEPVRTSI